MKAINLQEKHAGFTNQWHPHSIATEDNMQVLLAKLQGAFVWYSHAYEDGLFQVLKGTLYIQFRDQTEIAEAGEIITLPKGVEQNPMTKNAKEVHVLLSEKVTTLHTSGVKNENPQTEYPQL